MFLVNQVVPSNSRRDRGKRCLNVLSGTWFNRHWRDKDERNVCQWPKHQTMFLWLILLIQELFFGNLMGGAVWIENGIKRVSYNHLIHCISIPFNALQSTCFSSRLWFSAAWVVKIGSLFSLSLCSLSALIHTMTPWLLSSEKKVDLLTGFWQLMKISRLPV